MMKKIVIDVAVVLGNGLLCVRLSFGDAVIVGVAGAGKGRSL
jgi:hypothetical protein